MVLNNKHTNTKLYSALLVNMFSNIQLQREDGTLYPVNVYLNTFDQRMKKIIEMDQEERRKVIMGLDLPAIAIDLEDIVFDSERSLNKMNRKYHLRFDNKKALITYEDIPVDLMFSITVATKTVSDQYTIIEGIYGAFRNGFIKKKVPLPFYMDQEVVTPIVINTITPTSEMDFEDGGRSVPAVISLTVKGLFHSYIDGRWRDVLDYYSQFKLVDTDKDGIYDAYIPTCCDTPIQLGSKEDKSWFKNTVEELAKVTGKDPKDILTRPNIDLDKVGSPLIEKILFRVWETKQMYNLMTQISIKDQHSEVKEQNK